MRAFYTAQPATKIERKALRLNRLITVFTESWFPRDARKTNDALIELGSSVFQLVMFARKAEGGSASDAAAALYVLGRWNDKALRGVLRLRGDAAEKKKLREARARFIERWHALGVALGSLT
jgi:hypothetical protein